MITKHKCWLILFFLTPTLLSSSEMMVSPKKKNKTPCTRLRKFNSLLWLRCACASQRLLQAVVCTNTYALGDRPALFVKEDKIRFVYFVFWREHCLENLFRVVFQNFLSGFAVVKGGCDSRGSIFPGFLVIRVVSLVCVSILNL